MISSFLKQGIFKEKSETRQHLNHIINSNLEIIYKRYPELFKTAGSQLSEQIFKEVKQEPLVWGTSFSLAKDSAASRHEHNQYIIFNLTKQRHDLINNKFHFVADERALNITAHAQAPNRDVGKLILTEFS